MQGGEELVLSTIDPATFKVLVIEWENVHAAANSRIHKRLAAAGMVWQKQVGPFDGNRLYLRKDVAAFLPKYDIHDWRAPFEPSQES